MLISNHYITAHLVDVMVHTYNTLETICEAQEANWKCTCVMVRFDLNPPLGGPMELQLTLNSHKPMCEDW